MVTAAHAQNVPITPTTEPATPVATTENAPVPQPVAPPTKAISTLGLDLQFSDITVKDLLKTLGGQFGINIAFSDNVDGVISYINLTNQTPLEALQTVVASRPDLQLTQMSTGTYIVSKIEPGQVAASGFNAGVVQPQPITPGGNLNPNSIYDLSNLAPGRGNTSPGFGGQNSPGALPPLGQNPMNSDLLAGLPALTPTNPVTGRRRQKSIKIKNVPSSFIAYQLDPANNLSPIQLEESKRSNRGYLKGTDATNALADGNDANVGFNTFNQNDFAQSRTNPYLQNSASSQIRPQVRSTAQFGGGGGGFGNQNNNNQNNNNQNGGANGSFTLPDGIEQIVSVDPQNVLLIAYDEGSEQSVRDLQELIDVLDQPLRQVEIEAQFVELQSQDARTFGIDFSTARGNFDAATTGFASAPVPGSFQIGFVRNNFTATLNALIANNRAKVITAPRVTAINNLTATLTSTETRSLILTSVAQNIGGGQQQGQQLLFINTVTGLTVTPTINGDDTVTVLMRPRVSSQDGTTGLGTRTTRELVTVANVRDGDTIALGGLKVVRNTAINFKVPILGDIPFFGRLFQSKNINENQSELIIFLTARIIRRAGDDINVTVPGT